MELTGRFASAFLAILCLPVITGYPFYRDEIPNGHSVPHPCDETKAWKGVGHLVEGGGGVRNDFGKAFKAAGKTWTPALCRADSDGDGRTNGEELGDPGCTWSKGQQASGEATSHPGICEPIGSPTCKRKGVDPDMCAKMGFNCPATKETGTEPYHVTLPSTPVPARETTYMCMAFEFPSDKEYHMVGYQEDIDNINVMHHIIVYGCDSDEESNRPLNKPFNCFMSGNDGCETFIGIWTVGQNGFCFHPASGIRIGINGYKRAVLEVHWNNPYKTSTYTDSSGVTFYLTPNLRPHDAGVAFIGQIELEIPPEEEKWSQTGVCSPSCTAKLMTGPINVTAVINHMHYLGRKAVSEVVRPGNKVEYLAYDQTYTYDNPVFHTHQEPIQVNPGDQLEIDCVFNSMTRNKTTEWGFDTSAEMCYGFFFYYPAENFLDESCISVYGIDSCEMESDVIRGCDLEKLEDPTDPENIQRYLDLNDNCVIGHCKKECKAVVKRIKQHPCFSEELLSFQRRYNRGHNEDKYTTQRFFALLSSCDAQIYMDELRGRQPGETGGAAAVTAGWGSSLALLLCEAWYLLA